MVDMAVAMEDTALATTARGQLMLIMAVDSSVRPAHMVDMPTLLASAPLMLMPTTAMVDMAAMEAMEATAATATERGQLMPMPTTATEDMAAMVV